jgi:hypothetical protein
MPPRRVATPPAPAPAPSASPLANVALLGAAIGYGLVILVGHGRVSWPPRELLAGSYTLAGCLALVGPIVLGRRGAAEGGLGELVWMTGGLLIWAFDLAAALRGEIRLLSWATPLEAQRMGLTILAVGLAGWRTRGGARSWSWTNVTGWILGLFWIGLGMASLVPGRLAAGLSLR